MTTSEQEPCPKATMVETDTKTAGKKSEDFYEKLPDDIGTDYSFKRKIVWKNALGFLALHLAGLYGVYRCFYAHAMTNVWMILLTLASGEGVTIGAHRLFSHKSFKATFGLRFFLILLQTVAGQNCLYIWVRDHRQHHKYSDTDADPHNAHRGFFFSHIGWLMSKKHPLVIAKGKTIDMSDLEADWLVMFQKEFYKPLYVIFAIVLPVVIPVYYWNETYVNSFFICYMTRYIILLNVTWSVNSVAHLYGTKPFDKFIMPVESSFVSFIGIGEGWHNYHHTFPWDYRAAELGSKYNITASLIELLSKFSLAYDLKTAPYQLIKSRSLRTGDGTHLEFGVQSVEWGAKDETEDGKADVGHEGLLEANKLGLDGSGLNHRVVASHG